MLERTLLLLPLALLTGCSSGNDDDETPVAPEEADPAEVAIGERLFLEGRFAQFFADNAGGLLNVPLASGDPALDFITLGGVQTASPFAGGTMNCGACHMVDQALDLVDGGMRTYNDFAVKSAITSRADGLTKTTRNSPPLVNASIARTLPTVFHLDGEFSTLQQLVIDTLEGRNYGWLASEKALAEAHIAAVIRQDDGQGVLAADFGSLPYSDLLDSNVTVGIPDEFLLPPQFRIDMNTATDAQIVDAVAALIAAYTEQLAFTRDEANLYSASPYDLFLKKNGLPQEPNLGESSLDYARRLLTEIDALAAPKFVKKGKFTFHDQDFVFGATELAGLRIFLTETPPGLAGGAGNCVACHTPPDFTDFSFHNVGFTQDEYDDVHGPGAFLDLVVPDLTTRDGDPNAYLPPSATHPNAIGPFRASIDFADPTLTDLGLWNIFANAEFPGQQASILAHLDETYGAGTSALTNLQLLPLTEGLFKTPSLRDLNHSAPYGHGGTFATLGDVVNHYLQFSDLAFGGFVRNADPRLEDINLVFGDIAPLTAFLKSLDEDYE